MPDLFPDTAVATFAETLGRLGTITLSEMDSVRLLNRIDTKYVTTAGRLAEVLSDAAEAGYRALRTAGGQLSGYDSVYFDTPDLKMFMDHRNRRLRRQKVRTRVYVESGDAFLEIKRKDNKGRTSKKRIPVNPSETGDFSRNQAACDYLGKHSDFGRNSLPPDHSGQSSEDRTDYHRYRPVFQKFKDGI